MTDTVIEHDPEEEYEENQELSTEDDEEEKRWSDIVFPFINNDAARQALLAAREISTGIPGVVGFELLSELRDACMEITGMQSIDAATFPFISTSLDFHRIMVSEVFMMILSMTEGQLGELEPTYNDLLSSLKDEYSSLEDSDDPGDEDDDEGDLDDDEDEE